MNRHIKSNLKKLRKAKNDLNKILSSILDLRRKNYINKTIIINGFWRSGTTWFQTKICTSVGGKSVFEPFSPDIADDSVYINSGLLKSSMSKSFLHSFMPYSHSIKESIEIKNFLSTCFNAELKSPIARRLRKSIFSSFKNIVVCKFVRGHLILPYILENYPQTPIIHIYRNPKAVIASIHRKGWGAWLNDFYLNDHFIQIDDGRAAYFNKYKNLIDKYDKLDSQSRICAFWCITEKYILDTCIDKRNFLSVSYENLINNGFESVKIFLSNFDHRWQENSVENSSSATTNKHRKTLSKEEKRDSWKRELDIITQNKIDSILLDFGLDINRYTH